MQPKKIRPFYLPPVIFFLILIFLAGSYFSSGPVKNADAAAPIYGNPAAISRSAVKTPASAGGFKAGYVKLNFKNVRIITLIDFISKITGKNFIYSGKIKGRVTIISSKKIRTAEAYRAFLTALSYHGLTVVKSNGIYKIIHIATARQNSIRVSVKKLYASGNEFVTQIINLKYLSAQSMDSILIPLLSSSANIESYMPTNSLIITDYASNVRKADKIIDALDVPDFGQKIAIFPVKYVSAAKIAGILDLIYTGSTTYMSVNTINSQFVRIIPYKPTNALIIMATPPNIKRIIALANTLDVRSNTSSLTIHVYKLKYAKASAIAKILTNVASHSKTAAANPAFPGRPQVPPAAAKNGGNNNGGGVALIGKSVIIPDKDDNSLIIEATPLQYKGIKSVIKQLDVKRRQVFVQVIIAEIDLTHSSEYGTDYYGQNGSFFGGGNYNMSSGISAFLSNPFSVTGFIAGAAGGSLTLPIGPNGANETVPSFAALFRLIKTDSAINVLSAPDLLTLDNQKASIMVGEQVPFITSSATSQMELQNIVTQVQQQDVGVKLNITPTINYGNYLMLKINAEITAIIPSPDGMNVNEVGPTTSKRKIKTDIMVKNGQTVIIGGLIQNTINNTTTKIPILGDIPLIGYLFKDKSSQVEKDDLVVLISPKIINKNLDISKITGNRNGKFLNFMHETGQKLPGISKMIVVSPSYAKTGKK